MTSTAPEFVLPETDEQAAADAGPKPVFEGEKNMVEQVLLLVFIIVPFLALLAAIPVAWGWGLTWTDVAIFAAFYAVTGFGITVGYHRFFTHSSFKANRPLEVALQVMGSMAIEGPMTRWVADHRRHHAFSDRDGDPHSPWRYVDADQAAAVGGEPAAKGWAHVKLVSKGFAWAHIGWLFDEGVTNREKYVPDLMADPVKRKIDSLFPLWVAVSLLGPALLGGLITMSWQGAVAAFFWAGLVRVCILHHITWSVNSICHIWGKRPFAARDRSTNVWWLGLASFGESFHNLHHADPTAARHGVLRGQLDISARFIWFCEKFGLASEVRWPKPERLAKLRAKADQAVEASV